MASSALRRVLITGANRGIGAEFVRQYAAEGWEVLACCRNTKDVAEVGDVSKYKVKFLPLDVAKGDSVKALGSTLRGVPIDVLINNAGMWVPNTTFGAFDYKGWAECFEVNTMGPMRVVESLASNVEASNLKTLAFVSSSLGSIGLLEHNLAFKYVIEYRSSKAALNMVGKSLAIYLKPKQVKVVMFCPGWIATRTGGPDGPQAIGPSIAGMREIIANLKLEESGLFVQHSGGDQIPW